MYSNNCGLELPDKALFCHLCSRKNDTNVKVGVKEKLKIQSNSIVEKTKWQSIVLDSNIIIYTFFALIAIDVVFLEAFLSNSIERYGVLG